MGEAPLVENLRANELDSVASEVQQGRREHILKTLDERGQASELVRQQYSGRYPFELLQNANDAAATAGVGDQGAVRFVLSESALLIADQGGGFGADEIRAICGLGRSSKDLRKSIGYKGLGFKSVSEITDRPQIVSGDVRFTFDEFRCRAAVEEYTGELSATQRLPVYAFPFPLTDADLGEDAELIGALRNEGFQTILRLPFRSGVDRSRVESDLGATVTPRLLLLLDATSDLDVEGTASPFSAEATREPRPDHIEMLLQTDATIEHWRVYQKQVSIPTRELVAPLGDAWADVEEVRTAVAVRLDEDGRPAHRDCEPLHVYFPTQEHSGFSLVLHADFALELDRRRVGQSEDTSPYNRWLAAEVADLLATRVAPSLADQYRGDTAVVAALAPAGAPSGFGADVWQSCIEALSTSRFVPGVDGRSRLPGEAVVLPASVPDPAAAHDWLQLDELTRLVPPAAEAYPPTRRLLADHLGVTELSLSQAVGRLKEPDPEADARFYEFLVSWAESAGHRRFVPLLTDIRCVRTATGRWAAPERLFFPRKDDTPFPASLDVPVAALPEVEGLNGLLQAAGVQPFEWRELLTGYVLKLLEDDATESARRDAAFEALRTYYDTGQRAGGAQAVREQVGKVLLSAQTADGASSCLRPAEALYFSAAWLEHDTLERLYGPFGEPEFLALAPPQDNDERRHDFAFFEWLGVARRPRPNVVGQCGTEDLHSHPHAHAQPWWDGWLARNDVAAARACEQGHPLSQQLRDSATIDRLPQLLATDDHGRLAHVWDELARDWPEYEPSLAATFHCKHLAHVGERNRPVPSLLAHMLTKANWVPCLRGKEPVLVPPDRAWRFTPDTPRRVRERVAQLRPELDHQGSLGIVSSLGVVDAARPEVADLVALLHDLAAELDTVAQAGAQPVCEGSRWAMRTLNEVLGRASGEEDLTDVPLLARHGGEPVFSERPYVAEDQLLEEAFEHDYPILDADRGLSHLQRGCRLPKLDDAVTVSPRPSGVRTDTQAEVAAHLDEVKPYLAAVALADRKSTDEIYRWLSRLDVVVCDELELAYELDGLTRHHADALAYIAWRVERTGSTRRRVGTAYLELDPSTTAPHWFAFGPQLGQYLRTPGQGDAFALLLTATASDRDHYLASRRIAPSAVEEARLHLERPPADDGPLESVTTQLLQQAGAKEPTTHPPSQDQAATESPSGNATDHPPEHDAPETDESSVELPPIDHDRVAVVDGGKGTPVETGALRRTNAEPSLGPWGPVDHAQQNRLQRQLGDRGEEAVVEAERRRLRSLSLEPDAVVWRSQDHPYAPYDVESLDEGGQRIYIEVKSTTNSDPTDPFEISEPELRWAIARRSQAFVYRVTDAHTAAPTIVWYQDPIGLVLDKHAALQLNRARLVFSGDAGHALDDQDET